MTPRVRHGDPCPTCGITATYFSAYDSLACIPCDVWLEPDHCVGEECEWFEHTTGIKPSEAEK